MSRRSRKRWQGGLAAVVMTALLLGAGLDASTCREVAGHNSSKSDAKSCHAKPLRPSASCCRHEGPPEARRLSPLTVLDGWLGAMLPLDACGCCRSAEPLPVVAERERDRLVRPRTPLAVVRWPHPASPPPPLRLGFAEARWAGPPTSRPLYLQLGHLLF